MLKTSIVREFSAFHAANPNQNQSMAITLLLYLVNINTHKILVEFCPFAIKILMGNEVLTSIKGHNSVTNLRKRTGNNPNLNPVNINA